ncbi:MAG: lysylphosphatidylglycerol synthase transmembrane domain-containing protein [Paracoccaceae bacterium]
MSSTNPQRKFQPDNRPTGRWRGIAVPAVIFAVVLFGLIALAGATGWEDTLAQIKKLSWLQFAGLLLFSVANYVIRGFRWHIFARQLGLQTGFLQNMRHFLGGFAMIATPGRVGELVRMRWIRRETGWTHEKTAPLVLMDRASDLAAMALILGIAVVFANTRIPGAVPVALLALIAALVATRPRLLAGVAEIGYKFSGRWPRLFVRVRTAARSLGQFSNSTLLTGTTLIGAIGWFAEAYAFFLLLDWMGADITLATATAIFVFAIVVGGFSGAPGGVGGADAAMIALLAIEGVPLDISLAATAIIRVTTLWFGIAIGLLVFPFAERISKRAVNALENS